MTPGKITRFRLGHHITALGLTTPGVQIISAIAWHGPANGTELASRLGMERSQVYRDAKKALDRGYLSQKDRDKDSMPWVTEKVYSLTDRAAALLVFSAKSTEIRFSTEEKWSTVADAKKFFFESDAGRRLLPMIADKWKLLNSVDDGGVFPPLLEKAIDAIADYHIYHRSGSIQEHLKQYVVRKCLEDAFPLPGQIRRVAEGRKPWAERALDALAKDRDFGSALVVEMKQRMQDFQAEWDIMKGKFARYQALAREA
jgi:DNA-binding MarR family transcriptional regulator